MRASIIVVAYNSRAYLAPCIESIAREMEPQDELIVVDNGSTDGSADDLGPDVRVIRLGENRGFAAAANAGLRTTDADWVALVNSDVELAPDWLATMLAAAEPDDVASVAGKMVTLADPSVLDDTGDFLRRDGVCEQRGRGHADDGRWDEPGEVFSACAGAALLRRGTALAVGGFDERFFSYLEDVDLGLRLRLAGFRCAYAPGAVARHAGGGSSHQLERPVDAWVARNTLLLVAKAYPLRWAIPVIYRQLSWLVAAARDGVLRDHLRGLAAARPLLGQVWAERDALRRASIVPIGLVIDDRPWRGPQAGGPRDAGF
jgi:GT2 family glycosyltransferase